MSENELLRQRIALLEHENAALRQTVVALRIIRDHANDTPPMGVSSPETSAITNRWLEKK
jgi:hypothetical protein